MTDLLQGEFATPAAQRHQYLVLTSFASPRPSFWSVMSLVRGQAHITFSDVLGAARAAGSFCAENRFSLIIPCHRVVAANGIGGYGEAGPELKRRLLALEGVRL